MTRDEAIKALTIQLEYWEQLKEKNVLTDHEGNNVADILKMAIEALQQDPVVRCKDCRYWNNRHSGVTYCHRLGVCMTKADDYCCFGERREDG